jgi:hypothetical protein
LGNANNICSRIHEEKRPAWILGCTSSNPGFGTLEPGEIWEVGTSGRQILLLLQ